MEGNPKDEQGEKVAYFWRKPIPMSNLIVLSGAGISAESGLRTFRDAGGLWEGYDVQDVATIDAWERDPGLVLDFYNWRRKDAADAQPNRAHFALAEFEKKHSVKIITQNVDDLHERAGSSDVTHLHGELGWMKSSRNPALRYPYEEDILLGDLAEDGSQLRPDIVWFGEAVPMMDTAIDIVRGADVLLVVGTSLQVHPAAGLLYYTPEDIPIYLLDKNPPSGLNLDDTQISTLSAAEGMDEILGRIAQYLDTLL